MSTRKHLRPRKKTVAIKVKAVDSIALQKRYRTLTQEGFDKLLDALDSNRERAAVKYERIRSRLTNFFEYRGCSSPEEYADITNRKPFLR